MNISLIKPSIHGTSDKYSWNLYAYLRKHRGTHRILWDNSKGVPLHPMNVYVLQGNTGTTLLNILWSKKTRFHWDNHRIEGFLDITDLFWDDYARDGRCVFHGHNMDWIEGGEHRYTMVDEDTKECRWCGVMLGKTTVVNKVERWEVKR